MTKDCYQHWNAGDPIPTVETIRWDPHHSRCGRHSIRHARIVFPTTTVSLLTGVAEGFYCDEDHYEVSRNDLDFEKENWQTAEEANAILAEYAK